MLILNEWKTILYEFTFENIKITKPVIFTTGKLSFLLIKTVTIEIKKKKIIINNNYS